MKFKGFWYDGISICVALVAAAAFIICAVFIDRRLALAECAVLLAVCILLFVRMLSAGKRYRKSMIKLSKKLDYSNGKVLSSFPFPVALCGSDGLITWGSESFINEISAGELMQDSVITDYTGGISPEDLLHGSGTTVSIGEKHYSVFANSYKYGGSKNYILYYLDNTGLKNTEEEFFLSKPYAILMQLDFPDESGRNYRDIVLSGIISRIEGVLDSWAESCDSILKKTGDDRYLIITERSNFMRMAQDRFSVLQKVREFEYKGRKTGVTLSMGVSCGKNIKAGEDDARKALEMALGRGGDQVAIKDKDSYEFVGGVSKSAEKRTKVKSRVMGSALSELIKSASNVIVMGHAYSDFDSVGSAAGLVFAAKSLGVPAYIACDLKKTLSMPLIEKLERDGCGDFFIGGDKALGMINKKSLLILTDTHVGSLSEFPVLYETAETKVIIDHHRRVVADVNGAVIFHQDPGASSACEMVTELVQYMNPDISLSVPAAEALLAGIMLDTKSFVIRAGVRTFEAAAYLKDMGANTVSVKKLFSNSLDTNKLRNKVLSEAENFMGCAVSRADFNSPDIRVISAQAADEMLNISGIRASFVIYENDGAANISARSLGEINVQLIMEALGGGGHQTMAACRLAGKNSDEARDMLFKAIEDFYS